MPVDVHHAVLFTAAFVLLVSLMLSTMYVIVNNMLADAYRYERFLEKANEKVRVGGVVYGGFHYMVRNLGMTKVEIAELGYVDDSGNRYVLESSVSIDPGSQYRSSRSSVSGTPISVYVITRRGNVFSGPVVAVSPTFNYDQINLRTLLPSVHHILSPIQYTSSGSLYVVTVTTSSYVFGFVVAKDMMSDNHVLIEFGPYNVATFFKACSAQPSCQPSFMDARSRSSGTVSVSAKFLFSVERSGANPSFKITMPLVAQNNNQGLFVRGCVGMAWRTISTTFFSLSKIQSLPGWNVRVQNRYFSDNFEILMLPSSVNIDTLRAVLSNLGDKTWEQYQYADPPSGSIVEIYLVRCFTVIDGTLTQISFSPDSNPMYTTQNGYRIWTSLVFPGTNNFHPFDVSIPDVSLFVYVDLDMALTTLTS